MIRRCSKGHWYDTSTNKVCPHCKLESEKLGIGIQDVEEDDRTISIADVGLSLGDELGAIIGNSVGNPITGTAIPGSMASGEDDDKTISFGFFGDTRQDGLSA